MVGPARFKLFWQTDHASGQTALTIAAAKPIEFDLTLRRAFEDAGLSPLQLVLRRIEHPGWAGGA